MADRQAGVYDFETIRSKMQELKLRGHTGSQTTVTAGASAAPIGHCFHCQANSKVCDNSCILDG